MKTMKLSVTETMKELTLPKGEFVNIINGLFEVQNFYTVPETKLLPYLSRIWKSQP